ncbi:polysaccharide biosynthesis protein [Fredinandcohnia onubensis]|uniref:polysaccharide biosynthesis protein n=1 Tax=Fredinandcohnia onubensis TaxID=1571209 RepID=UPI000C0BDA04|nr:nucleoside-diphosphate sugar epimerase/dehydratase [Fredinandcohnia onubensis]
MSYRNRVGSLVLIDSMIVLTAIYISYYFLHPYFNIFTSRALLISSITLLAGHHVFAYIYRLYKRAWEYASIGELISLAKAITFSIITLAVVQYLVIGNVYVRVLMLTWMMHILFIGGSRFSWRIFRDSFIKDTIVKKRTLIVGAGAAGTMLARQLQQNHDLDLKPVAFVDDDVKKQNLQIYNVPVLGGVSSIEEIVKMKDIENIIIAIPSLSKKELNEIFQECSKTSAKTQIMPLIEDVMLGKVTVNSFRDVQVEDLLGREPVQLDTESISEKLTGKTILVTGAGGSIGSEICRQVSKFNPKKLVLVGHGENSIYLIDMELRNKYGTQFEIIPVIGDVQDRARMFEVIEKHSPDVVYHAAAHKHVPLMEYNPKEAVKNNVFGTRNVAEACDAFGVKNFVLVSTDKAVNPTNVMGATKRMAELVIQNLALTSKTKFAAVRFGNVLGSRGSVIPLFKKQIQAGGPVTVTHPEMTRYFMTIPEASRLVLQAGALARGGEIFVLDMGEPVKIVDLAKNLITLSGYTLDEIEIRFSGLRPGEKMFEELLNEDEIHLDKGQIYPKIYIGKTYNLYTDEVKEILAHGLELETEVLSKKLIDLANNRVEPKKEKLVSVMN